MTEAAVPGCSGHSLAILKKKVVIKLSGEDPLGPILEFKGNVRHIQKGHPTLVTQVDLILQNR